MMADDTGEGAADGHSHSQVKGLMMPHAGSEEEAMNLFFEGETNRAIAEHQVFFFFLTFKPRVE